MSILDETVRSIIAEVGETVEIVPHAGYQSDGIWESDQGYDTANSFEVEARVMRQVSNKELEEQGFSDKGECIVYFNEEEVSQGDKLIFTDSHDGGTDTYFVSETVTNQLGDGVYRQVAMLRRSDG